MDICKIKEMLNEFLKKKIKESKKPILFIFSEDYEYDFTFEDNGEVGSYFKHDDAF